ncbi:hypothetical protein EVAR_13129_1 [Eumeta japonica]|uniref:Uncharacterized protein n=1 Tax=Eumeta variegata TaxID=151549 RepID=A0A4C1U9W4_EUMVA|nr:hypothetical protein EVAR_13129_1 [Eumeta japonica]
MLPKEVDHFKYQFCCFKRRDNRHRFNLSYQQQVGESARPLECIMRKQKADACNGMEFSMRIPAPAVAILGQVIRAGLYAVAGNTLHLKLSRDIELIPSSFISTDYDLNYDPDRYHFVIPVQLSMPFVSLDSDGCLAFDSEPGLDLTGPADIIRHCLIRDLAGECPQLHQHGLTLDSDPVPTLVFDPTPVLNFDCGLAFDSDPGPVLDSAFRPAFNSVFATNHSPDFNETGSYYENKI